MPFCVKTRALNTVCATTSSAVFELASFLLSFGAKLLFALSTKRVPFSIAASDRVVDSKDVLGVNLLLKGLLPLNGVRAHCPLDELLSNLADSVVMGDAATALHDFVSGAVLDILVSVDGLITRQSVVVHSQVDVDSSARLVDLGNTEAHPEALAVIAELGCLFVNPRLDFFAERGNLAPRAGELKGLTQRVVVQGEVSCVGNQESEQVATHAVLRAANKATKLLADGDDVSVSLLGPHLVTLEKHRARSQLVGVKALDLDDEELFGSLHKLSPHRFNTWLHNGSELELSVVYKSQRRGPAVGLTHCLHKLDADLIVVEDNAIVDLGLGNGSGADGDISDNSEITLATHHDVMHVGPVRDSWPEL